MTTAVVPATNPLADLVQEPAFLDLVIERSTVTMADLPDLLGAFSGREVYYDPYAITRLIDITASFADNYREIATTAGFIVVPEHLWRRAGNELPLSDAPAPDDLIWAEPGYRHGHAVIVPNTGGTGSQLMLYRFETSMAHKSTTLVPVRFPIEPAGAPGDVETDCYLTWLSDGDWAERGCAGQCAHGTCTASRYHANGRPEMVDGCYCG
jgi:hypothetical protein